MADLRARLLVADDDRLRAVLGEVMLKGAAYGFVVGALVGALVTGAAWAVIS